MNHPSAGQRGFSLVEVLIAAALLFVIVIGITPIFARSAISNAVGADSTQISNHSKSRAEQLLQVFFDDDDVTLVSGSTERMNVEYWDESLETFTGVAPATGDAHWTRQTRVRQFNISDLNDGVLDNPLDGGTDPGAVQLKEIQVQLQTSPQGPVPGRTLVIRTLKPF